MTEIEQVAHAPRLGKMLEYLDPTEDAEYQLKTDAERLMKNIEAGIDR